MGQCLKCGRENPSIFLAFGTCQSCRTQQLQADLQEKQNRLLEDQLRQQQKQYDEINRVNKSAEQSRCNHEYVATAYDARSEPSYGEYYTVHPVNFGPVKTYDEDHLWIGKCRYCGIVMTQYEVDNCRHQWVKDYYLGEPASQCARCGFVKPDVLARANELIKKFAIPAQRSAQRQQALRDLVKYSFYFILLIVGIYLWGKFTASETVNNAGYEAKELSSPIQAETQHETTKINDADMRPPSETAIDNSAFSHELEQSLLDDNFQSSFEPFLKLIHMRLSTLADLQRNGYQSNPAWKNQYNDACNALIDIKNYVPKASASGPYRYCKQMLDQMAGEISIAGQLNKQALSAHSQGDFQARNEYQNESTQRIRSINQLASDIIIEYRKQTAGMDSAQY